MPFAGYKDFAACVASNGDKKDPEGYCASIMRQVEKAEMSFITEILKKDYSTEQRIQMAKDGQAIPIKDSSGNITGGRFPIADKGDLEDAIHSIGRANNEPDAKAHIISRARALGATDSLPEDWNVSKSLASQVREGLTKLNRKPQTKLQDERIADLGPSEVTLTGAPAVREDILVMKSKILSEAELTEIAKSLKIEKVDDIPDTEIKKFEDRKQELAKTAIAAITENEVIKGLFGQPDPNANPNPFAPKPDAEDVKEGPEDKLSSVSNAVTIAAKALAPVMQSLPPEVAKFFQARMAAPAAPAGGGMMKSDAELFKSTFPGVFEEITKSVTEPLQKTITEQGKLIQGLQTEAAKAELTEIAKSITSNPSDEFVAELGDIRKAMKPEAWDAYLKRQRSLYTMAHNGDALKQISKTEGSDISPQQAIEAKAREIIAKSEKSWDNLEHRSEAIRKAMSDNPELAKRYDRQMSKNAAAVGVGEDD